MIVGFLAAIAAMGYVGGVGSAETGEINACSSGNRFIRFVGSPTECGRGETTYTWNVAGPAGPAGQDGADGATWYSESGGPDSALGRSGDLYFDSSNGDVYKRGDDAWLAISNLTGPEGPQGPEGRQGLPGATGATGAEGPMGPAGEPGSPDRPHSHWIGRWQSRDTGISTFREIAITSVFVYLPSDAPEGSVVTTRAYAPFSTGNNCSGDAGLDDEQAFFLQPGAHFVINAGKQDNTPPTRGCLSITSDHPIYVSGEILVTHDEKSATNEQVAKWETVHHIDFWPAS